MNRKFFALVTIIGLVPFTALAGVKVASVGHKTSGGNGLITVGLEGRSSELPDLKANGSTIEVTLSQAEPFNAIYKNVQGATLSANSINGKNMVKAVLPYDVRPEGVSLGWKNKNIEII